MASKSFKLTDNQLHAARRLYRTGKLQDVNGNTIKSLVNKGVIEQKPADDNWRFYSESFQFTVEGKAWADVEFGTPDPDDDSDPDPMTARDAMEATEDVLADSWLSPEDEEAFAHLSEPVADDSAPLPVVADATPEYEPRERQAGEIVDMYSVKFEVQPNGILKQLPPVAANQNRHTNGSRAYVTLAAIKRPKFGATKLRFADTVNIDGYKLSKSAKLPSNFNLGAKKVSLPNMQKTDAKTPNTRRAMSARQLGRMLKAKPISRKPQQRRNPLAIQRDMMFLNWIMGDAA